jgi:RimJ/RimL family protein N-acetyltransferase
VRLIPVDPENERHVKLLYELLLARPEHANISHQAMPTFECHAQFMKSHPYEAWYLIDPSEEIIDADSTDYDVAGAVYLTRLREIGIFLFPQHQAKYVGRDAVIMLMETQPSGDFFANIAPLNTRSQEFFIRLGFSLIQYTYRKGDSDVT